VLALAVFLAFVWSVADLEENPGAPVADLVVRAAWEAA